MITDVEYYGLFGMFHEVKVVIVREVDWLVEDFIKSCEERIRLRFEEMGINIAVVIPEGTPELTHIARRPRSVWE